MVGQNGLSKYDIGGKLGIVGEEGFTHYNQFGLFQIDTVFTIKKVMLISGQEQ